MYKYLYIFFMNTHLISLQHYRAHLPKLWKEAQEKNITYIVTMHSKPAFEVRPLHGDLVVKEAIVPYVATTSDMKAFHKAQKEFTQGKMKTAKEVFDSLRP